MAVYREIIINGIQISREPSLTGIQRVCREIILRIDNLVGRDSGLKISYAFCKDSPHKIINPRELHNIRCIELDTSNRYKAQLFKFPKLVKSRKAVPVSFALDLGCRAKNQIFTIYDLRPVKYKNYDSFKFRLKFYVAMRLVKKYAKLILTDSDYQNAAITDYFGFNKEKVHTFYCGWEHLNNIETDETIFERNLQIKKGEYFYTIGSLAPHKNFKWILEVAKRNENKQFIIAGGKNLKAWKDNIETDEIKNVHFIGYVTDEENKALLSNCKAFLFPSKYEGFGLPPLEALACGVPIIISDATCLPEIYEDSAHYINPDDYEVDLDVLLNEPVAPAEKILQKCSWDVVSMQIYDIIKAEAKN